VSNEITPALGKESGDASGRNIVHETQLLREQLLEPPRPQWQSAAVIAVCAFALLLIAAGFAMFAALA
jgi:hypothetical protein